jgi:hypothetical protein
MRTLSKSKILAHRQCPKRLWLELQPDTKPTYSAQTIASFAAGHSVGAVAQALYDPRPERVVLDAQADGYDVAAARTAELLSGRSPFFEALFSAGGALAFADVMQPHGRAAWKMIEVKSSTSVKDYHRDDAAIQYFVATQSGVKLKALALAHIDSTWVYPGGGDYNGMLVETDLTAEVAKRTNEVAGWIAEAQATARKRTEPNILTGAHCKTPFPCGFIDHCAAQEPQATYPVSWLPNVQTKALKSHLSNPEIIELEQVPDELLTVLQQRVKAASLSGKTYFDAKGAAAALKPHKLPAYFLDFETINPAVPLWAGTHPFQQVPFQFSCHRLSRTGTLQHREFLHTYSSDPSGDFVAALLVACDAETSSAPIFVYNQGFESARIKELATRFAKHSKALLSLVDRLVDLLPIAKTYYYHPSQQGSWSIKAVLPALVPDLAYDQLDEVQDGGGAQQAFLEIIASETTETRRAQRVKQLLAYCKLDTLAMVRVRDALLATKR